MSPRGTLSSRSAEDLSQTRIELNADSGSISVREGVGGMQALGEDDKLDIKKTIDDEVLKKQTFMFRSTGAAPAADGNGVTIRGDLTLNGKTRPIEFELDALGRRPAERLHRHQAERLRHEAVLDAVRRAEGG